MTQQLKRFIDNNLLKYSEFWIVILIFFISFLVRLFRLGYHDFWYDEADIDISARWINAYWKAPLHKMLMLPWVRIFGTSEFSLRFPSLLFSFFTVVLLFFLGRRFFNKKIGLIASFIMGLCPFHIWYAQEARDYSMVLFFGTL